MRKLKYILGGLLFFSVLSIISSRNHVTNDFNSENIINSLTDSINKLIDQESIVGLSITILKEGKIYWSAGFGYADLENKVTVTPAFSKFRIGSVSKPITSVALGILSDEKKLKFEDNIQTHVNYFPQKKHPITIAQVGGHNAGIRHYRGLEFMSSRKYYSVKSAISIFKDDSLLFEPTTRHSYSSYGWNLLSAVVEGASGDDFLHYMNNKIFTPLKMNNTIADFNDSIIEGRVRFYAKNKGEIINATHVDLSNKWAGGGFLSTSEDVARFAYSFEKDSLLNDSTKKLMITPQTLKDGKNTGYGIGWFNHKDYYNRQCYGHYGGSIGGRAIMVIYPEEEIIISILANTSGVNFRRIDAIIVEVMDKSGY